MKKEHAPTYFFPREPTQPSSCSKRSEFCSSRSAVPRRPHLQRSQSGRSPASKLLRASPSGSKGTQITLPRNPVLDNTKEVSLTYRESRNHKILHDSLPTSR